MKRSRRRRDERRKRIRRRRGGAVRRRAERRGGGRLRIRPILAVYYLLLTTCYLLPATCHLLLTADYALHTYYNLLLTTDRPDRGGEGEDEGRRGATKNKGGVREAGILPILHTNTATSPKGRPNYRARQLRSHTAHP